ncbi:hypothetical protein [Mycobacterium tuberculosis]|uniref:hypothetical protein n=1 Tax=Mycobacterium tuberculosis TaxID=1773 RepID=UPI0032B32A53
MRADPLRGCAGLAIVTGFDAFICFAWLRRACDRHGSSMRTTPLRGCAGLAIVTGSMRVDLLHGCAGLAIVT